MIKVVIHAGMYKTGTTSLQQVLAANRGRLAERGIIYPDDGTGHHGVFLNVKHPIWSRGTCEAAVRSAVSANASMLLFSGEVVSTLSSDQLHALADAFDGCELSFVLAFRHWVGFLPSMWATYCRRRDSQTFDEYLARISASSDHADRRFDLVLERACSCAPTRALSFDNAIADQNDIVRPLLDAIGVADVVDPSAVRSNANARPDWREVELCRLFNGVIAARRKLAQNELFLSIENYLNCQVMFTLLPRLRRIPPDIVGALKSMLDHRQETRAFAETGWMREMEDKLNAGFAGRFVNLRDGRVFPTGLSSTVHCTTLDWRSFEAEYRELVDAALDAMSLPVRAQ